MPSAFVLAAGYGTRLRPLTDRIPKPLLPVGDRPLLAHTLEQIFAFPTVKVTLNAHHCSKEISNYINSLEVTVNVSVEEKILGTAGGLRAARGFFDAGDVLVVNGDIHGKLPLGELLAAGAAELLLAVVPTPLGTGTVGVGRDGRVVRLRGERFGEEVWSGDYMGVMRVDGSSLEGLPEEGCLVGDVALPRLRSGSDRVRALRVEGTFLDIGSPEAYLRANLAWLELRGSSAFVAPSATVADGVELTESVLLEGARVRGRGAVRRVVALPGARFEAPLTDSIVLADGRVVSLRDAARSVP